MNREDAVEVGSGEVTRLLREISATRRLLRRALIVRALSRGLLAAAVLLLAAALGSRVAPVPLPAFAVALAAAVAFLGTAGLFVRRLPERREAALWLDRVLEGEEHFIAALELSEGADDSEQAASVARGALRCLDSGGGRHTRRRVRVDWFVPGLLAVVAAVAVMLLPRLGPESIGPREGRGLSTRDARSPGETPGEGSAPGTDASRAGSRGDEGGVDAGSSAARGADRPRGVPARDGAAPETAGSAMSGRGEEGGGTGREGSGAPPTSEEIREALRRLRDGRGTAGERDAILGRLERSESDGSGAGGEGASASSASGIVPARDSGSGAEPRDPGSEGPGSLAGRFPARYRDLVARYFDPSL